MTDAAPPTALERLVRQDRWVVAGALTLITLFAWIELVRLAGSMDMSGGMKAAMTIRPWGAADFVLMFWMWAVMMVAMMLPSAAPMILLHARVQRRHADGARAGGATALFVLGYLIVWTLFSLVATLFQWGLERAALLSPMMVTTSPVLGGAILIAAGLYQWTPLKDACLSHCRSPVAFVMAHWRPGRAGAFRMGLDHGAYCVGCCWALMALLFFGGVMSFLWIAGIAAFVLLEKLGPPAAAGGRLSGALLMGTGLFVLLSA